MEKRTIKIIAITLIILGLVILANWSSITGNVISDKMGEKPDYILRFILGLGFIIGGIVLLEKGTLEKRIGTKDKIDPIAKRYFERRANEILNKSHKGDVFISQWEVNGILNTIRNKEGYIIEYGRTRPGFHIDPYEGKPPHFSIKNKKGKFSKHLLITSDPYDSRLYNIGFETKGKYMERVKSKTYNPHHPRKIGNEEIDYTRGVDIHYKQERA